MALIAGAALQNPEVRKIASSKTYRLSSTLNNVDGITLQMEHQLLNGEQYSYPYAFAGKTGYTALAGNTLVTAAKKEDKELLTVVLKSEMTHYKDTISLLNYGFQKAQQQEKETETIIEQEPEITSAPETQNISSGRVLDILFHIMASALVLAVVGYTSLVLVQRYRRRLKKARRRKR